MRTTKWGASAWIGSQTRAGRLRFSVRNSATNRLVFSSLLCCALPRRLPILISAVCRGEERKSSYIRTPTASSNSSITFYEFKLREEAGSQANTGRFPSEFCAFVIEASASIIKGTARLQITYTVLGTATGWCSSMAQFHHDGRVATRTLMRFLGQLPRIKRCKLIEKISPKLKRKSTWSGKLVTFSFSKVCWWIPLVDSGVTLTVKWDLLVLASLVVDATGTGRSSSDKIKFLSLVPCDFFWVGSEASDEYASSSQAHWSEKSTDSRQRWTCKDNNINDTRFH